MADLPLAKAKQPAAKAAADSQIKVTPDNAAVLAVHFLSQIYGRLGYIIKLLEKKEGK